ncbi:unnamed protein product [Sphenostylis stenocarpa]|uniref:Uncharacterized protein n=1 Tax=Sphenostylis stenocarpa TaxID=92480 RepID=A0AA86RZN2_9FABA|nr:unnamed protein product [Sphenostylis stenocarpa]
MIISCVADVERNSGESIEHSAHGHIDDVSKSERERIGWKNGRKAGEKTRWPQLHKSPRVSVEQSSHDNTGK